jgi:hypothetical protein
MDTIPHRNCAVQVLTSRLLLQSSASAQVDEDGEHMQKKNADIVAQLAEAKVSFERCFPAITLA